MMRVKQHIEDTGDLVILSAAVNRIVADGGVNGRVRLIPDPSLLVTSGCPPDVGIQN
jgi:hypothetical protein